MALQEDLKWRRFVKMCIDECANRKVSKDDEETDFFVNSNNHELNLLMYRKFGQDTFKRTLTYSRDDEFYCLLNENIVKNIFDQIQEERRWEILN